jgi:hypothetical protein
MKAKGFSKETAAVAFWRAEAVVIDVDAEHVRDQKGLATIKIMSRASRPECQADSFAWEPCLSASRAETWSEICSLN